MLIPQYTYRFANKYIHLRNIKSVYGTVGKRPYGLPDGKRFPPWRPDTPEKSQVYWQHTCDSNTIGKRNGIKRVIGPPVRSLYKNKKILLKLIIFCQAKTGLKIRIGLLRMFSSFYICNYSTLNRYKLCIMKKNTTSRHVKRLTI